MHIFPKSAFYRCLTLLWFLFTCTAGRAQIVRCTMAGQTPATPINVCGTLVFKQSAAPVCSNGRIHVPGCMSNGDNNPYWYKITCYSPGTLGFVITPGVIGYEDYDWQLFDVTGHSPAEVFSNDNLFVSGNWSGGYYPTGTSDTATRNIACGSGPDAATTFSKMPLLTLNHVYLLMVSRANPKSTFGYTLSFGGGTALITDTTQAAPVLKAATPNCAGNKLIVPFSKKIQCGSLATNGSDFNLSTTLATITAARAINCSDVTGMDSAELTLSNSLPVGNYTVVVQQGRDGNTLYDMCGNEMAAATKTAFSVQPSKPVDMDSLVKPGCQPQTLTLVFKKNIYCNSVAANGSDFILTGPQAVNIVSAKTNCSDGFANTITLGLSSPITQAGVYTITLQQSGDGNTIIDECNNGIPAGQQLNFTAAGAVSAAFSMQVMQACTAPDTLTAAINNNANITNGNWLFDDGNTYSLPAVTRAYSNQGSGTLQLNVTNGTCSDTVTKSFTIMPKLRAAFTVPQRLCPKQQAVFNSTSTGAVTAYLWHFGNGDSSRLAQPVQVYPLTAADVTYQTRLIVHGNTPCYDTAYAQVTVLADCSIAVPAAFTPNHDNHNDYLYPVNAYNVTNLVFRVFNRWGQVVFETNNIANKWDGTYKGLLQPAGVYVWQLSYTKPAANKQYTQRGTSVLIR